MTWIHMFSPALRLKPLLTHLNGAAKEKVGAGFCPFAASNY
jgi:hypothetical protein